MPDATIHWHQVNSVDVSSWEFQFQRVGSEGWEWVQRVEPTDGCPECFQAVIEIPRDAILVRSRGIGVGGIEGEWSDGMSAMYSSQEEDGGRADGLFAGPTGRERSPLFGGQLLAHIEPREYPPLCRRCLAGAV